MWISCWTHRAPQAPCSTSHRSSRGQSGPVRSRSRSAFPVSLPLTNTRALSRLTQQESWYDTRVGETVVKALCLCLQDAAAAPQVRKAEVTDECPPGAAAGANLGDPRRPGSAFSEATLQTGAQPAKAAAKQLKVRVSLEAPEAEEEESMSRAQSTAQALAARGVCPCPSLVSRGESSARHMPVRRQGPPQLCPCCLHLCLSVWPPFWMVCIPRAGRSGRCGKGLTAHLVLLTLNNARKLLKSH